MADVARGPKGSRPLPSPWARRAWATLAAWLLVCVVAATAPPPTGGTLPAMTVIDAPGAGATTTGGATGTGAIGINDIGQIVGGFIDERDKGHAFFRSAAGAFTVIDIPGATDLWPPATGINNAGQIVGWFSDARGDHGFVRAPAGQITVMNVPGASATRINGINDRDQIVGEFTARGTDHGFVRDAAGHLTVIDVPGATASYATGISNTGEIAGWFDTGPLGNNENHGFLRSAAGRLTTINVTLPGAYGTVVRGINAAGDVVGNFFDGRGRQLGFLRTAAGAYATIAVPDQPDVVFVTASGINRSRHIVGAFLVPEGYYDVEHGFLTAR